MNEDQIKVIRETLKENVGLVAECYEDETIDGAVPKFVDKEIADSGTDYELDASKCDATPKDLEREDRALIASAMSNDLDDNGVQLILRLAGFVAGHCELSDNF